MGPPTCAHTVREIATKFRMVIKPDERITFSWSTTNRALAKFVALQMQTRDLFTVAKLLIQQFMLLTGSFRRVLSLLFVVPVLLSFLLHCALSSAAQCIVIGPVCDGRALFVAGGPAGRRAGGLCLLPR